MQIKIAETRASMGKYVAEVAARCLQECLANNAEVNLVVATGSSQFEVLDSLVRMPGIDWTRINGFHLDEYLGLASSHPASFCGYLKQRFVQHVPLRSFYYLDGLMPAAELISRACAQLQARRIDLMLCGIGENGHLAFNDPPADFAIQAPYHVVQLDEACRRQQVGEGWFESLAQVPTQAISMSIQQILKAQRILCSVPDQRKAEAVQHTVEGPITPDVPASILKQHANTTLILDTPSSSLLSAQTLAGCERV